MSEARVRASIVPLIWCDEPRAAIEWLERAFGFEAVMIVGDDDGGVIHSELALGNGAIYVVGPPGVGAGGRGATPRGVGGRNTQTICVNLTEGIDAHCERARKAGARIEREPADQPYGDRVYTCVDPEGHEWAFCQPVKVMSAEEMAQATGREIETKEPSHG
jgi:uncharacterized glyoxalase superfamily protein PhnB